MDNVTPVLTFTHISYEMLLRILRVESRSVVRERITAELRSRDRAMHNQWVQACGGEYR